MNGTNLEARIQSLEIAIANTKQDKPEYLWQYYGHAIATFLGTEQEEVLLEINRDESGEEIPILGRESYIAGETEINLYDRLQYTETAELIGRKPHTKTNLLLRTRKPLTPAEQSALAAAFAGEAKVNYVNFERYRDTFITPLTGMPNELAARKFLRNWKEQNDPELARYHGKEEGSFERRALVGTLYLADINLLGRVNKHFGQKVGDDLLKLTSKTIREFLNSHSKEHNFAAWHLHGDEFAFFTEGTSEEYSLMLANTLRNELASKRFSATRITSAPNFLKGETVNLPLSVAIGHTQIGMSSNYEAAKKHAESRMNPEKLENGRKYLGLFPEDRKDGY